MKLPPALRAKLGIKAKHKYNVAPKADRTFQGIVFDSKAEMRWYQQLLFMQQHGAVVKIERQVKYDLPGKTRYYADFRVTYSDGHVELQDCKGVATAAYRIKARLMKEVHGITIREIKLR